MSAPAVRAGDERVWAIMRTALLLVAAGSFPLLWAWAWELPLHWTGAWSVLAVCVMFPLWTQPLLRRQAFHPLSYFIFNGIISFVLPSLLLMGGTETAVYGDEFASACFLLGGAYLLYWVGWRSPIGPALARAVPLWAFDRRPELRDGRGLWTMLVVAYVLGWIGRITRAELGISHLPVELGAVWRVTGVLADMHALATVSWAVMGYQLLRRRTGARAWAPVLALLVLEVCAGLLDGGRTATAIPVLQLLVIFHFARRPIRWRVLLTAYLGGMLVLAPLLTIYRSAYYVQLYQGMSPGFDAVVAAGELSSDWITSPYTDWNVLLDQVFDRGASTMVGTLSVLDKVPSQYEYQGGDTFIPGLTVIFIPRVLWADKPIFLPTRHFAVTFFGFEPDRILGTSAGIGMPAEAYYNFGWFGLLMFPLGGIFLRFLADRLRGYRRVEPVAIARVFYVLFLVAAMTGTFLYTFTAIIRDAIVYMAFLALITRQLPRARRLDDIVPPDRDDAMDEMPAPVAARPLAAPAWG